MSQAKTSKLYRTFVKGLVTEASYLTYPEDTSLDELNTVLSRKGNRTRRFGMNYNTGSSFPRPYDRSSAKTEYMWTAVAQKPGLSFLVVQNGADVRFFDRSIQGFIEGLKPFSINLQDYARPGVADVSRSICSIASGKGYLFIVSESIEPLVVEYSPATNALTITTIAILARDFEGLPDGLQNDEEPSTLTKEHHYNLQNQGWVTRRQSTSGPTPVANLNGYSYYSQVYAYDPDNYYSVSAYQSDFTLNPIYKFQSKIGRYPGNNKQWWVARADADDPDKGQKAGDFLPEVLDSLFSGNNRAPRGHYILNQFRKDRSALSGISGLPVEDVGTRPNSVTFFSGRAWYASGSTIYYSQILDTTSASKAGLCYQEADPTAEDISDLIASDGGVVPIPEANHIEKIAPLSNGVMVFAQNGVWFISGGDSAFSALNISVSKVSPIGTKSPGSIVETDGTIFWWSEIGIQAIQQASGQFGPIPGRFGNTNISEQTIQTFYNNIPPTSKSAVKSILDERNNVVYWLYSSTDSFVSEYDSVLCFDLSLQAFYPWKFSMLSNGPRINGIFLDSGYVESGFTTNVTNNNVVVTASGANVVETRSDVSIKPSSIQYLVQVPGAGLTLASPMSFNFVDWESFDGVGATYDSYLLTGYELNNDAMRDKQIVYLFAHFRFTEDEFGNNQSSCKMTARWDWAGERNPRKWSSEAEVYRPRTINLTDVVVSKNKVRGNGKSVQFRFGCSERGKTFDLLGWSVGYSGSTEP